MNIKEKILGTGTDGFIGHHLVRFLRQKGYWVRGVDIKEPEYSSKEEMDEFLLLDLRDLENCKKSLLLNIMSESRAGRGYEKDIFGVSF